MNEYVRVRLDSKTGKFAVEKIDPRDMYIALEEKGDMDWGEDEVLRKFVDNRIVRIRNNEFSKVTNMAFKKLCDHVMERINKEKETNPLSKKELRWEFCIEFMSSKELDELWNQSSEFQNYGKEKMKKQAEDPLRFTKLRDEVTKVIAASEETSPVTALQLHKRINEQGAELVMNYPIDEVRPHGLVLFTKNEVYHDKGDGEGFKPASSFIEKLYHDREERNKEWKSDVFIPIVKEKVTAVEEKLARELYEELMYQMAGVPPAYLRKWKDSKEEKVSLAPDECPKCGRTTAFDYCQYCPGVKVGVLLEE